MTELLPITLFEWIKTEYDQLNFNLRTKYKADAFNRLSGKIYKILEKILENCEQDTEKLFISGMDELISSRNTDNQTEIRDLMIVSPSLEQLIRKLVNYKVNQSRVKQQPKFDLDKKTYYFNSSLYKTATNNNTRKNSSFDDIDVNLVDLQDDDDDAQPILVLPKRQDSHAKKTKTVTDKHQYKVAISELKGADYSTNETLTVESSSSEEPNHPNRGINQTSNEEQNTTAEKNNNDKHEDEDRYLQSSLREETLEDLFSADNDKDLGLESSDLNTKANEAEASNQDIHVKQEVLSEHDDEELETGIINSREDEYESDEHEEQHVIKEEGELTDEDNVDVDANKLNTQEKSKDNEDNDENANQNDDVDERMDISNDDSDKVQGNQVNDELNRQVNITPPLPDDIQIDEHAAEIEQAKINRPTEYEISPRKLDNLRARHAGLERLSSLSVVAQSPSPLNRPEKQTVHKNPVDLLERIHSTVKVMVDFESETQNKQKNQRRKRKINDLSNQIIMNNMPNSNANVVISTSTIIKKDDNFRTEEYSEHSQPPWHKNVPLCSKTLATESITSKQQTNLQQGKIKKYRRADYEREQKAKRAALRKNLKVSFNLEKNMERIFEIDEENAMCTKTSKENERTVVKPFVNKFLKGPLRAENFVGNCTYQRHRQLTAQIQGDIKSLIDFIRNQREKVNMQNNKDFAPENEVVPQRQNLPTLLPTRLFITDSMLCNLDESVFRNMAFLRLDSNKNMEMLINFGLEAQCQHIINNLCDFEFSYIFLLYGYDLIAQQDRVPSVEYVHKLHEWFNTNLVDHPLVKPTEESYTYHYTIPQFVLITVPELGPHEKRIQEFNVELRQFVETANNNTLHLIDWATLIKDKFPKTDDAIVRLLVYRLSEFGVLCK